MNLYEISPLSHPVFYFLIAFLWLFRLWGVGIVGVGIDILYFYMYCFSKQIF